MTQRSDSYKLEIAFVGPDGTRTEGYKYRNPDGSVGGAVAASATIDKTALIEEGAIVGPEATIGAHAIIRRSARVKDNQIVPPHQVVW